MSLNLPIRQSARSVSSLLTHLPCPHSSIRRFPSSNPPQQHQRRTIFDFLRRRRAPPVDPLSDDFLKKSPKLRPPTQQGLPQQGTLAPDSIFGPETPTDPSSPFSPTPARRPRRSDEVIPRDPAFMAPALNPNPSARARWQRKMVIRSITKRGRISKTELIARTERAHLHKTPFLETSVKKLMPVARQIAGKSVAEALVQMRFSKKKMARDVKKALEYARDEAIVTRGMGLGGVVAGSTEIDNEQANLEEGLVQYEDKKGKNKLVKPSEIYIDQAWVGRGKYERLYEARARGRVNMIRRPHTSISFLLKEQKTQIRLAQEREEKKREKKPWVHHPDRPITAQSQYILW